jgi:hypothetical protein
MESYYIFVACIKRNTPVIKRLFLFDIPEPNTTYTFLSNIKYISSIGN